MPDTAHQLLDMRELTHLLDVQAGVIARSQLTAVHARDHDIRRMVRRRELTLVHQAVYVNHTGPLTDKQRAWAAVLARGSEPRVRSARPGRQASLACGSRHPPHDQASDWRRHPSHS